MSYLVFVIPLVVILFEYVAVSSALAYAKFAVQADSVVVSLLGGIIRIGGNLPFDAVPNTVVTLHLLGLLLSVIYFVYFIIFTPASQEKCQSMSPQE